MSIDGLVRESLGGLTLTVGPPAPVHVHTSDVGSLGPSLLEAEVAVRCTRGIPGPGGRPPTP